MSVSAQPIDTTLTTKPDDNTSSTDTTTVKSVNVSGKGVDSLKSAMSSKHDEFKSSSNFDLDKPAASVKPATSMTDLLSSLGSEKSVRSTKDVADSKADLNDKDLEDADEPKSTTSEQHKTMKIKDTEISGILSDDEVSNPDEEAETKSAAEVVAAAAASLATQKKTVKKTPVASRVATTLKTANTLMSSKQQQVLKQARLMLNNTGNLQIATDEPLPNIVKLNTPVNKAQIKIRNFRLNFEKQYAEMKKKTPADLQLLKSELDNIEFAEVGNRNIIKGLLELVDDTDLKMLTIEKMLKMGDITISF